jgi:antitoxin component of MazEF toxin-antitoxin module
MTKEAFVRTVRKSGCSNCINIPVEVVKLLKLEEGDMVKVTIEKMEKE